MPIEYGENGRPVRRIPGRKLGRNDTDIVGYSYKADLYCSECILRAMVRHGDAGPAVLDFTETVEDTLTYLADCMVLDRTDERTFDSGEFPKVVTAGQVNTSPRFPADACGSCGADL